MTRQTDDELSDPEVLAAARAVLDAAGPAAVGAGSVAAAVIIQKNHENAKSSIGDYHLHLEQTGDHNKFGLAERGWGADATGAALFVELNDILGACQPIDSLHAIYRATTRGYPFRVQPDDDAGWNGLVQDLRDFATPDALLAFLTRVSKAVSDPWAYDQLSEWVTRAATLWDVSESAIKRIQDHPEKSVLLVRMDIDLLEQGFGVMAWLFSEGRAGGGIPVYAEDNVNIHDVEMLLSKYFKDLVNDFVPGRGSKQLSVQFLVDLERIDNNFEEYILSLEGCQMPIGSACLVSVRPKERLGFTTSRDPRTEKWSRLCGGAELTANERGWVTPENVGSIASTLVCAGLAHLRRAEHIEALRRLLSNGTPAAVWHRHGVTSEDHLDHLTKWLTQLQVVDLPSAVMMQRIAASHPRAAKSHPGRNLILMWDDPDHLPAYDLPLCAPTTEK